MLGIWIKVRLRIRIGVNAVAPDQNEGIFVFFL
jgi:hypothetical protein